MVIVSALHLLGGMLFPVVREGNTTHTGPPGRQRTHVWRQLATGQLNVLHGPPNIGLHVSQFLKIRF